MVEIKMLDNALYEYDVKRVVSMELPWERLRNSSVVIAGSTGLIGSFLVDVVMQANAIRDLRCKVYALGRSEAKARQRFGDYYGSEWFDFVSHDINRPMDPELFGSVGYVVHLASNTHPVAYATDPIGTISANIMGTYNLLEFAAAKGAARFAFASSNEIYGENRGDKEFFDETYCGYIDSNTLRAGYPESKRCGEALCQAFKRQKGLEVVIPRLTRSYGPTMLMSDTKAISQFILKGVRGEDIVMKSAGTQYYSYTYVADAVSGLLTVLLCGCDGEAYNIADDSSDIRLKDLAGLIAGLSGCEVIFEVPDDVESAGYSRATKARLDGTKLKALGWRPMYGIREGLERTLTMLKSNVL